MVLKALNFDCSTKPSVVNNVIFNGLKQINKMEELIKKIRAVEPTTEQAKDRTPEYAFGWIDSLNAITEIVKNNVVLQNVMSRCISETVKKREDQILKVLEDNGYNLLKLRT